MKTANPWRTLKKVPGVIRRIASFRLDDTFQQALDELATRETERLGVKISQATLIQNLTTRDSNFFRAKRSELREVYETLNKEKQHGTQTEPTNEDGPDSSITG